MSSEGIMMGLIGYGCSISSPQPIMAPCTTGTVEAVLFSGDGLPAQVALKVFKLVQTVQHWEMSSMGLLTRRRTPTTPWMRALSRSYTWRDWLCLSPTYSEVGGEYYCNPEWCAGYYCVSRGGVEIEI